MDHADSNPLHLGQEEGLRVRGECVKVPGIVHAAEEASLTGSHQLLDLDLLADWGLGDVGLPLDRVDSHWDMSSRSWV